MSSLFFCQTLELEGFRGFIEKQTLNLHPNMNILYGINGSGKSSVLRALNFFLGDITFFFSASDQNVQSLYQFINADINNSSDSLGIKMELSSKQLISTRISYDSVKNLKVDKYFHKSLSTSEKPVILSYSVNRSLSSKISKDLIASISKPDVYDNNLNSTVNFTDFIQWFNLTEAASLQKQVEQVNLNKLVSGKKSGTNDKNRQELDIVENAIGSFTGFDELTLDRDKDPLELSARKGNIKINLQQMSDGEKCLLALVGDIARRLIQLNPGWDHPLEGCGIILIDEADLHLHPSWQRNLIPGLCKTFPNIQFILTTHSPQVLSQVMDGKVFSLKTSGNGCEVTEMNRIYGQDTNRILEELMETTDRPSDVKNSIKNIYKAIDSLELDNAKKMISTLKDKIGNDSELDRATVMLEIKEAQQK